MNQQIEAVIFRTGKETRVVEYRTFRNSDPPRLFALWKSAGLGRAAAQPNSIMAFEVGVYALPYFDAAGLIVAESAGEIVGFVHAGFGWREDSNGIDRSRGVICGLIVHPGWRRQGIGRELVRRAEDYLQSRGTQRVQFGQSRRRDPFYFGLHGGARPSGIYDSDPHMVPFLANLGYVATGVVSILQRDLTTNRDPTNFRLIGIRRQTELLVAEHMLPATFAWFCQFGNIESMRFRLMLKKTGQTLAAVTVVGLDHFMRNWGERAIGLVEMEVAEPYRGQGYGTTLLIESLRRLRSEMNITLAELHVPTEHAIAAKAVQNAGFIAIDKAHVYERPVA